MSEIELHRKLLGDAPRNAAFHAALKSVIVPGKTTVADLGAGTGFLSFLARQLGAVHCTLVEYTDTIALAQQLARANRIDGLSFIQGHSAQLKRPEKVDVVVSETLGNYALEENLLETLNDARRWLKKTGVMIPCGLQQFVAPVVTPRLQHGIDIWSGVGFALDLSAARTVSLNNMYVRGVTLEDLGGSEAEAQCWDALRFAVDADAAPSLRRKTVQWSARALGAVTVQGYALWWAAELVPGVTLSTAPSAPATHWEQIYLPLLQPITLGKGDTLECTLTSDTRPEAGLNVGWRTRHLQSGKALATLDQDIIKGRIEL
jgi:protein arginine N-methyltransferase 1